MRYRAYIPNLLTYLRIVCGCLIVVSSVSYLKLIFLIGILSDGFDGYLARRWKVCSYYGAMIDPIADRLFFYGLCIRLFCSISEKNVVHLLLIPLRDIAIFIYWFVWWLHKKTGNLLQKSPPLESLMTGKALTIFHACLVLAILCNHEVYTWCIYPHIALIISTIAEIVL